MSDPAVYRYTKTHEWVFKEGDTCLCGITDFAQNQLTDIVFVELPVAGKALKKGERAAVVESVKSVSDIYAPVSGEITETNDALSDSPELVNEDAFGNGWLFKIKINDPAELLDLMSKEEYDASLTGGAS